MKAICYNGIMGLRTETVPDPSILNAQDAIVRVTMSSVCGSDLHLLDGYVPTMREGDIIGHEFMGEVVETGPSRPYACRRTGRRYCGKRLHGLP